MASKRNNNGILGDGGTKRGRIEITTAPADGKPGDWVCPNLDCKHHNYAFREICQKCFTDKYGDSVERVEGKKPGDWNCPIDGNLNYAWRSHCQKCGNANSRQGNFSGAGSQGRGNFKNPNDWSCPSCGDHVFASRTNCRKCGCSKNSNSSGMGQQMRGMGQFGMHQSNFGGFSAGFGGRQQGGNKGLKAGDWTCPGCYDLVYASRSSCRKCNTPKPIGGTAQTTDAIGTGGVRSTGRPGDWTCPKCDDHVYASRANCRKCDTPKPDNAILNADCLPELFGGDWRCPKCFDHVYASRDACRKCTTPKP